MTEGELFALLRHPICGLYNYYQSLAQKTLKFCQPTSIEYYVTQKHPTATGWGTGRFSALGSSRIAIA